MYFTEFCGILYIKIKERKFTSSTRKPFTETVLSRSNRIYLDDVRRRRRFDNENFMRDSLTLARNYFT